MERSVQSDAVFSFPYAYPERGGRSMCPPCASTPSDLIGIHSLSSMRVGWHDGYEKQPPHLRDVRRCLCLTFPIRQSAVQAYFLLGFMCGCDRRFFVSHRSLCFLLSSATLLLETVFFFIFYFIVCKAKCGFLDISLESSVENALFVNDASPCCLRLLIFLSSSLHFNAFNFQHCLTLNL